MWIFSKAELSQPSAKAATPGYKLKGSNAQCQSISGGTKQQNPGNKDPESQEAQQHAKKAGVAQW
jgi:hypothetical protein